ACRLRLRRGRHAATPQHRSITSHRELRYLTRPDLAPGTSYGRAGRENDMPKPKKGPRLGGSPAHQRLILSNLATALFEHGRITTTEAKARTLRPYAEKLITK